MKCTLSNFLSLILFKNCVNPNELVFKYGSVIHVLESYLYIDLGCYSCENSEINYFKKKSLFECCIVLEQLLIIIKVFLVISMLIMFI